VAAMLLVGGCGPATPDSGGGGDAVDPAADSGPMTLPKKDAAADTKDSGLETKDSGLGTKDSGLDTKDGAPGMDDPDAGDVEDAGTMDPPDPPDAGEMNECFACAQARCAVQVNACTGSPACVEEGNCDLMCLTASGGVNAHCVQACTKDLRAAAKLLAAVTCGFKVCPRECLRPLISCGQDAGAPPAMTPYGHSCKPWGHN